MRETFQDLIALIGYYYYLKSRMENCPSNFPDARKFLVYIQTFNAMYAKSTNEERYAFIGDIDNYFDNICVWWEKIIFFGVIEDKSYQRIVYDIRKKWHSNHLLKSFPGRLYYRQNIKREFRRIFKETQNYFKQIKYLE